VGGVVAMNSVLVEIAKHLTGEFYSALARAVV
jgi:hypothetical protein